MKVSLESSLLLTENTFVHLSQKPLAGPCLLQPHVDATWRKLFSVRGADFYFTGLIAWEQ